MTFRDYLIEMVGTFLLTFVAASVVCVSYLASAEAHLPVGLVGIAVAQGCVLAVLLGVSTRVSDGCLNPAVTLALWVTRRFDGPRAFALIAVQLLGATFAGGLVVLLFDHSTLEKSYAGTPHLRAFLDNQHQVLPGDWLLGTLAEAVLTFLITLALLTGLLEKEKPRWGILTAGLALTAAVLAGYHLTGAALNPARWFGCAVWQRSVPTLTTTPVFRDHLPYWMGPTVGALLAGLAYAEWLRPPQKKD
jgi:aquaporin Z